MSIKGIALATAAASLFVVAGCASNAPAGSGVAKMSCTGGNACKGNSDCKSANNSCAGQNACKGQGFVMVTQANCDLLLKGRGG